MITGFEEITYELTKYENETLLPVMIGGLRKKLGAENAITSAEIISKMKDHGLKASGPRIRKLVNFIRVNNLIPNLVSTSKGYYISQDPEECRNYIESLGERIRSITTVYDAMRDQYRESFNIN